VSCCVCCCCAHRWEGPHFCRVTRACTLIHVRTHLFPIDKHRQHTHTHDHPHTNPAPHTHTHPHPHTHTHSHTHTHTHPHNHTHTQILTYTPTRPHPRSHSHTHPHLHILAQGGVCTTSTRPHSHSHSHSHTHIRILAQGCVCTTRKTRGSASATISRQKFSKVSFIVVFYSTLNRQLIFWEFWQLFSRMNLLPVCVTRLIHTCNVTLSFWHLLCAIYIIKIYMHTERRHICVCA